MARSTNLIIAAALVLSLGQHATAEVTVTTHFDDWSSAAGAFTTLDFTGFAPNTQLTTQYSALGATFTDGPGPSTDYAVGPTFAGFPLDGWGVSGGLNDEIHISLSTPQYSFGTHFPGAIQYWLYDSGELIYISPPFFASPDPGEFAGLVSTQPFDSVMLRDPEGLGVGADNIYFASGVPAPGALGIFGVGGLIRQRRRRL